MDEFRPMTADYKFSYINGKEGAQAQIAGIESVLAVSAEQLLARREVAQTCVNMSCEALQNDQAGEAVTAYMDDGAMPKPAWDLHRKVDIIPFNPTVHVFSFMKARMFLSNSHAVAALLRLSKKALTSAHKRPSTQGLTMMELGPLLMGFLGESAKECTSLQSIIFGLLKNSLALRGAHEELVLDLTTTACGLLIRQMQYVLPQAQTFSEKNYRWLINTWNIRLLLDFMRYGRSFQGLPATGVKFGKTWISQLTRSKQSSKGS